MTTNHIDQLTEWWENAEEGVIERGDTVINRSDGETTVYVATERARRQHPSARILSRAPKPKPAWRDAVAVLANHRDYADERRTVWVQIGGDEYDRVNIEGDTAAEHHLVNVTPLIEAKVTDEMVLSALNASVGVDMPRLSSFTRDEIEDMRHTLAAALGLDTE